ncbi:MAG: zinc-ribbon domain-containing protein [Acholeplasmataceae bacterium]|jgi:hypothetical protein|nr:zinc-ribbon domain-containing protein [Acholeplasmataceae bacterium]
MECKSCKKTVPNDTVYCPYCGIKQEEEKCKKCGKPLLPNAKFCMSCGTPTSNSQQNVQSDFNQSIEVESSSSFVEKPERITRQVETKDNKTNPLIWIKASLSVIMLGLLIGFLFLPMGKVSYGQFLGNGSDVDDLYLSYSVFDTFEASTFLFQDKDFDEFTDYILTILEDELDEDLIYSDYEELTRSEKKEVERAFNKINPFSSLMIPEVRDAQFFSMFLIMFLNIVFLIVFIVYLIFLIKSIIKLSSKQYENNYMNIFGKVVLISFFYFSYISIINKTFRYVQGSSIIAILVVSLITFFTYVVFNMVEKSTPLNPKFYIKKGVNLVSLIIIVLFISGSSLVYSFNFVDDYDREREITISETNFDFILYLNNIYYMDFEVVDDDLLEFYELLLDGESRRDAIKMMELLQLSQSYLSTDIQESTPPNTFIIIVALLSIMSYSSLILLISKNILDFKDQQDTSKKASTVYTAIVIVITLITIASGFYLAYVFNASAKYLEYDYRVNVAFGQFVGLFLLIAYLIWNLIFKVSTIEKNLSYE